MSNPQNSPSTTVHPLFDDDSFYRRSTAMSVWSDSGHSSICDFFERWHWEFGSHLRRKKLITAVPLHPGWSEELNAAMAESIEAELEETPARLAKPELAQDVGNSRRNTPQNALALDSARRSGHMAAGQDGGSEPILWITVYDPDVADEVPEPYGELLKFSAEVAIITGLTPLGTPSLEGQQAEPPFGPLSTEFVVRVPLDGFAEQREFGQYGIHGHRMMFLLLRSSLINRLNELVNLDATEENFPPLHVAPPEFHRQQTGIRNRREAIAVLTKALKPEMFVPNHEDSPQRRKAYWLQTTLGMAPGLETMLSDTDDPIFDVSVDLQAPFATLRGLEELASYEFVETNNSSDDEEHTSLPCFFVPLLILGPRVST